MENKNHARVPDCGPAVDNATAGTVRIPPEAHLRLASQLHRDLPRLPLLRGRVSVRLAVLRTAQVLQ